MKLGKIIPIRALKLGPTDRRQYSKPNTTKPNYTHFMRI
jgi:hypothetical protein